MRIEFLLEEYSMKIFLENILPKILPEDFVINENYFLRSHEGKSDLQKSIPKKIMAFNYLNDKIGVVIVHDQDSNNCKLLKQELVDLCNKNNSNIKFIVRIVCKELESWYLGDMYAIQKAYPNFNVSKYINRSKYRTPDNLNAYDEIKLILPIFQKIEGARKISPFINFENNRSISFQQFIKGVKQFIEKNFQ